MVEEVHAGDGACEKCDCEGWRGWQPGNPECGNCGHSYSNHKG